MDISTRTITNRGHRTARAPGNTKNPQKQNATACASVLRTGRL
jgi:hypothetical protein